MLRDCISCISLGRRLWAAEAMGLSVEQVVEMAPDAAAVAAGKKLAAAKNWQSLGRNAEVLWGLCQGSAVY